MNGVRTETIGELPAGPSAGAFTALVVDIHSAARATRVRRLHAMGAGSVAEAGSQADAEQVASSGGRRDLCVVRLGLPDGSGLELIARLRAAGWRSLVVLSPAYGYAGVRAAFEAGAHGLVFEGTRAPALPADRTRAGRPAPGLAAAQIRIPTQRMSRELSSREIDVLRLVADGRSNREAGQELHLSALTVKSHLARIARKLGTGDRAEMVAVVMRAGLIR
ncbi:MAG: response regulator transcription factor [Actinomycetota bacterium]|nr:response regulator transcription factor [Actinomycetota bacterium]